MEPCYCSSQTYISDKLRAGLSYDVLDFTCEAFSMLFMFMRMNFVPRMQKEAFAAYSSTALLRKLA